MLNTVSDVITITEHMSLPQGISNPEFCGDLVYELKKIIGNPNISDLYKRNVNYLKK